MSSAGLNMSLKTLRKRTGRITGNSISSPFALAKKLLIKPSWEKVAEGEKEKDTGK